MKKRHPLIETLFSIRGNQRACVFTEPLWDIPFNLYSPYVSLYMVAIGLKDAQIGAIVSIGFGLQFFWSLMSGAITDKFGRRWTTLIFDVLSWSVPLAIWALSQGYWHFLAAAFFNAIWRVTSNSWGCLLVEDGDDKQLVRIFTLVDITSFIAGMVSPVVGIFIDRYTLVPTLRVIYWIAFVMMTTKFVILFFLSRESTVGKQRMLETKNTPLLSVALGGIGVFKQVLKSPATVFTMVFLALLTCFNTVQGSFWPLFVSSKYVVSDALMAVFPAVKASITMLVFFTVTPRIRAERARTPLLIALAAHGVWIILLLACSPLGGAGLPVVFIAVVIEALGAGIIGPLAQTLLALNVNAQERARIYSISYAAILAVSTPMGWIAGQLSNIDRSLPLVLNLVLIASLLVIALMLARAQKANEVNTNAG